MCHLPHPEEILEPSTRIPSIAARKQGQDDEMLAFARDAHQKALVAAALLKERNKRLGLSTSRQHSCCWHSGSH